MRRLSLIVLLLALAYPLGFADILHLKNGGKIEGEILSETAEAVRIKTTIGTVDIARTQIDRVERKRLPAEEYGRELKALPAADVLGHFALGMWCKEHRLSEQAEERFRHVLKLSPDHAGARRELGFEKFRGRWMTREEAMIAKGYIKHQGKWVTPDKAAELTREAKEKETLKRIAMLAQKVELGSATGRKRAMQAFTTMKDPLYARPLGKFADHEHRNVRMGVILALTNIRTGDAADELARVVLIEDDIELRTLALDGIRKIPGTDTVGYFTSALRVYRKKAVDSKKDAILKREVLSRASWALGEIGERRAVPTLISVLVVDMGYSIVKTKPQTVTGPSTVRAPEIGPDGKPTGRTLSGRFSRHTFGGTETAAERVIFANEEALNALRKLTGQSFGLDKARWGEWWLMNKPILGPEDPFDE